MHLTKDDRVFIKHANSNITTDKTGEDEDGYSKLRAIKKDFKSNNGKGHVGFATHSSQIISHRLSPRTNELIKPEKPAIKRKGKSEIDSDEDEDVFKTVVSTKGQFTSFFQVRNISKVI